jgi:hypothetical protein
LVRTVALLISAISLSRPTIQKDEATRYAKVLNEIASKYDFDPLFAVAMIHYESHWLPSVASDDGEDFGLGQVRARFVGACRTDEDPLHAPSDACKAVKVNLLVGENNLRQMGVIIAANKKMCAEKRGKNKPEYWLAGYQGLSQPERNKWCTPGPTTTRVIDYHKELLAQLTPQPKAKAAAIAKAPADKGAAQKTAAADKGAAQKGATAAKGGAIDKASPADKAAPQKTAAKTVAAKPPAKAPPPKAAPKNTKAQRTPVKAAPARPR